ncbi:hypothetical protein V6N11_022284 [Hibiscus sabdariffa]|uniref:FAD-dependent oxidoreductase 2 FAD-binding domain-containing protein n=1 Tax=Hibiscus sabdariffa TaxID=183260 RepID=A0ABR2TJH8_9ROSI
MDSEIKMDHVDLDDQTHEDVASIMCIDQFSTIGIDLIRGARGVAIMKIMSIDMTRDLLKPPLEQSIVLDSYREMDYFTKEKDYIEVHGNRFWKPFVEKHIDGDYSSIMIYYGAIDDPIVESIGFHTKLVLCSLQHCVVESTSTISKRSAGGCHSTKDSGSKFNFVPAYKWVSNVEIMDSSETLSSSANTYDRKKAISQRVKIRFHHFRPLRSIELILENYGLPCSQTKVEKLYQQAISGQSVDFGKDGETYICSCVADGARHALLHTIYVQVMRHNTQFVAEYFALHILMNRGRSCPRVIAWILEDGTLHQFQAVSITLLTKEDGNFYFSVISAHTYTTGDGNVAVASVKFSLHALDYLGYVL